MVKFTFNQIADFRIGCRLLTVLKASTSIFFYQDYLCNPNTEVYINVFSIAYDGMRVFWPNTVAEGGELGTNGTKAPDLYSSPNTFW
jgi:hypothetical protein